MSEKVETCTLISNYIAILSIYWNLLNRKVAGSRPDEVNDFYQVI
jgi:hypothetical protein